ncbi:MAG TPA: hypothetical protein VFC02_27075 [Anaerolineales bacterium]|jgi:hypothetical protein|nr:hypothetical protein [Anaerolineales bacterium]
MRALPLQLSLFILFITACSPAQIPTVLPAKSGDILFEDEFENNSTGWDRVLNDNGIMDYDQGSYRILVQQPTMNFWSTPEKNFRDVRVEADVIRLNGPDENRAGLICRYQSGDYYFFIISSDGFYAIGKFIGGNTILLGQSEMQSSEFIISNSTNHLRADCIGNTLTFFVNFNQIAAVQDTDFPSGDVGLLAGTFSEAGVDVSFDHFVVMQP